MERNLEIKGVKKTFGKDEILKGVNLNIKKGEFFSILGPSGCGKTTILRMIAGFIKPDEGEILLKSPSNLLGYYKNEKATAAAYEGEYLKTGDLGYLDASGNLFITGRMKDIFKTSKGKYIAPEPIELSFGASDLVEIACLCGSGMEQPLAMVVLSEMGLKSDPLSVKKDLEKFVRSLNRKLEAHEKIAKVVTIRERWTPDNGMLTPTMKVKRRSVESRYSQNFELWLQKSEMVCVGD